MKKYIAGFLLILLLVSCGNNSNKKLVLISRDYNKNIETWLTDLNDKLDVIDVYQLSSDVIQNHLLKADGIIIGGGEDVNPNRYGKPEYVSDCGKFDDYRDALEIMLIEYAMENKVPILGICRGQQILNVANGGTLIPDIPTYTSSEICHRSSNKHSHSVTLIDDSWLMKIMDRDTFPVNSTHHQAVDELAPGFKSAAYAPDNIIESIEYINKKEHPFAMGIQWHPEIFKTSISNNIGKKFLTVINAPLVK